MNAYVADAVRTPRGKGKPGGGLAGVRPVELVAQLLAAVERRGHIDRDRVDDVILGCVTQVGDQGANVARTAVLWAGWPDAVPGMTVNRFCCSGLDAIGMAAARVHANMADAVLAGGVESMSRVPMFGDDGAWFRDREVAERTGFVHMMVAADVLAARAGIERVALDACAARSHRLALSAPTGQPPDDGLVAVDRPGAGMFEADELPRPAATESALAELPPLRGEQPLPDAVTARYPGLDVPARHTIGTAPAIADGASLVAVTGTAQGARARIRAVATTSVEPVQMLHGNVDCTRRALALAGLEARDVDAFEVNESFAAVPLHFCRELGVDSELVNIAGGAIALGHPLGATGGVLVSTLLANLRRTGGTIGVASICGGAGVATSLVVERLS